MGTRGSKTKVYVSFRKDFALGDLRRLTAEDDPNLSFYYVREERYVARALSRNDSASVFLGPRGVGKSAILQMTRSHAQTFGDEARLIELSPDDLIYNALSNIDARTPFFESPSELSWLFTSLWDYVICLEILRKEPNIGTIESLASKWIGSGNTYKKQQLLKLTLDDKGNQRSIMQKVITLVSAIKTSVNVKGTGVTAEAHFHETNAASTENLELLNLINSIAKTISTSISREYYILIDDLDVHWTGTELQRAFLGALFYSIRKLSKPSRGTRKIKFIVSLRTHIFDECYIEERGKFRDFISHVSWEECDLKNMIQSRMSTILNTDESEVWTKLFPPGTFDRFLKDTNRLPREMLGVAIEAIETAQAEGTTSVTESQIDRAIENFSRERRAELVSFHELKYPGLGTLLSLFSLAEKQFDFHALEDVALTMQIIREERNEILDWDWATSGTQQPLNLARILLEIGFLDLKSDERSAPRIPTKSDIGLISHKNWYAVNRLYQPGLKP
ncbi:MAG: hypothetical protein CMJ46_01130 [Planctomyces sp.]|nr:hypothetical protein [Planctomyces sp.]